MKNLLILMGCCFTAILLATSCTTESIEDDNVNIVNNNSHPLPIPPPPDKEHGDDDRDKDKDDN